MNLYFKVVPRRTLYDFKLLSDHEQYDVVFSEGTFIDALIEENTPYALYAVTYSLLKLNTMWPGIK